MECAPGAGTRADPEVAQHQRQLIGSSDLVLVKRGNDQTRTEPSLMRRFRQFTQALARIEDLFAEAAIAVLVLCAISICIDVVMRYFVGRPIMGSTELTEY